MFALSAHFTFEKTNCDFLFESFGRQDAEDRSVEILGKRPGQLDRRDWHWQAGHRVHKQLGMDEDRVP